MKFSQIKFSIVSPFKCRGKFFASLCILKGIRQADVFMPLLLLWCKKGTSLFCFSWSRQCCQWLRLRKLITIASGAQAIFYDLSSPYYQVSERGAIAATTWMSFWQLWTNPVSIRSVMYATNVIEQTIKEIRKRLKSMYSLNSKAEENNSGF